MLTSGTKLGPYEILAPLGAGGMGEVYRSRDARLNREVAVKVLAESLSGDPAALSRFEREAKAVAALNHPNILSIHDYGHEGDITFAVMELLEGETLQQRLKQGPLPVSKATDIAGQIAKGLTAAHEKSITHRDLKPANIFLTKGGHVKILDFGLARVSEPPPAENEPLSQGITAEAPTRPGVVMGTIGYMSPEQARGLPADARSDIFAFGVVLYEMLSGKRAFQGGTASDTLAAILTKDPDPLPPVTPPGLDRIVRRCLEKRAEDRFSSAHDLAFALEAVSGSTPAPSAPAAAAPENGGRRRRHQLLLGGGVLAVAAIVGTLAVWRPWHAVPKPAGTVAGHIPSILALPCKVYGAPEVAFLTDAVPGTISTLLAQVKGMDTKVPPTSFEVEKVKGDLAMLAALYQVSSFIVTSITTSPGRFALNVQLVDAATRKVRWGKQYEGPREAYDELARQAAEGIRQFFSLSAAPVPTSPASSEADLAFREGLYFSNNYNNRHQLTDFDLASRAFTRALELDPTSARAAAEIAMLHVFRWEAVAIADKDAEVRQVESWAQKAIQLDPDAGEGWSALAEAENIGGGDLERMVEHGLKGASLAPRYAIAHQMLSYVLRSPGSESLALAAARTAREINPLYLYASVSVARGLICTGEPQEALRIIDQVRALEPGWKMVLPLKVQVLTKLSRFREASDALREYTPSPDEADLSEGWRQAGLALALAEGDDARVKSLMAPLSGLLSGTRGDVCVKCYIGAAAYTVAPGLARTLRTDDALRILLRSVELGLAPSYDFLLQEPGFQPLKSDPRFAMVLAGSRDAAARTAKILEQSRARGELPKYLETPLDELLRLLNQQGGKR